VSSSRHDEMELRSKFMVENYIVSARGVVGRPLMMIPTDSAKAWRWGMRPLHR